MSIVGTVASKRSELVAVATAMLEDRLNLIEGALKICALRHLAGDPENELFMPIRAIESETDHFPLAEMRQHCAADYLQRIDAEISRVPRCRRKAGYFVSVQGNRSRLFMTGGAGWSQLRTLDETRHPVGNPPSSSRDRYISILQAPQRPCRACARHGHGALLGESRFPGVSHAFQGSGCIFQQRDPLWSPLSQVVIDYDTQVNTAPVPMALDE